MLHRLAAPAVRADHRQRTRARLEHVDQEGRADSRLGCGPPSTVGVPITMVAASTRAIGKLADVGRGQVERFHAPRRARASASDEVRRPFAGVLPCIETKGRMTTLRWAPRDPVAIGVEDQRRAVVDRAVAGGDDVDARGRRAFPGSSRSCARKGIMISA